MTRAHFLQMHCRMAARRDHPHNRTPNPDTKPSGRVNHTYTKAAGLWSWNICSTALEPSSRACMQAHSQRNMRQERLYPQITAAPNSFVSKLSFETLRRGTHSRLLCTCNLYTKNDGGGN